MSFNWFITTALLAIVFIHGYHSKESVILDPELVTALPPGAKLEPDQIICFNAFWEIKKGNEAEERKRWNCPKDNCDTGPECCASYKVWDKTKATPNKQMPKECNKDHKRLIQTALSAALKEIKKRCGDAYKYQSDVCKKMESELVSAPGKSGGDAPTDQPSAGGTTGAAESGTPSFGTTPSPVIPTTESHGIRLEVSAVFGLAFVLLCIVANQLISTNL